MMRGSWCSSPPLRVNPHGAPPKRQTFTSFQPSPSLLLWVRSPGFGITGQNLTASAEWTSLLYASASISLRHNDRNGSQTSSAPQILTRGHCWHPDRGCDDDLQLKTPKDQLSRQWETDRALSGKKGTLFWRYFILKNILEGLFFSAICWSCFKGGTLFLFI